MGMVVQKGVVGWEVADWVEADSVVAMVAVQVVEVVTEVACSGDSVVEVNVGSGRWRWRRSRRHGGGRLGGYASLTSIGLTYARSICLQRPGNISDTYLTARIGESSMSASLASTPEHLCITIRIPYEKERVTCSLRLRH